MVLKINEKAKATIISSHAMISNLYLANIIRI